MSTPSLVLWMQIEPLSALAGVALGLATYLAACPRRREGWSELGSVGWQVLAIAATAPAFLFGAELSLWLGLMGYRAPLALTGLVRGLGWALLALGPIPIVAAVVYGERPAGRWRTAALGLLSAGLALSLAGPRLRDAAWARVAARAAAESAALDEALTLDALRYASPSERDALLARTLPTAFAARALVERARDAGRPLLSTPAKAMLARSILTGLSADPAAVGPGAEAAIWWLTDDPAAVLVAHALATPALRPLVAGAAVDAPRLPRAFQTIAADGLDHGDASTREAIAAATFQAAEPAVLEPALIAALSARIHDPDPTGRLAWNTLLRDASANALRPLLPTYADAAAPQWEWLLELCPKRTPALIALEDDADSAVAAGARKLFAYVKLNCKANVRRG